MVEFRVGECLQRVQRCMKKPPVNLATVPFEHARRVRRALLVAAAVVGLLSVLHAGVAAQMLAGDASADALAAAEQRSFKATVRGWQQEAEALAAAADRSRTRELADAVALADGLISWRLLPWEPLFAALEAALPDDVRLELVQPSSEEDSVQVEIMAAARSRAALGSFLTALEEQPVLSAIVPTYEERGDDGRHRMTIRVTYRDAGSHGVDSP